MVGYNNSLNEKTRLNSWLHELSYNKNYFLSFQFSFLGGQFCLSKLLKDVWFDIVKWLSCKLNSNFRWSCSSSIILLNLSITRKETLSQSFILEFPFTYCGFMDNRIFYKKWRTAESSDIYITKNINLWDTNFINLDIQLSTNYLKI